MNSQFLPGVYLSVISHQRPSNVPSMSGIIGPATWYVPKGQGAAYTRYGAPRVVEVEGRLVQQRNAALTDAWSAGLPCCQLDDDLKGIKRAVPGMRPGAKTTAVKIGFGAAMALMRERLAQTAKAKLAGTAPTANPFFYPNRTISTDKFIIASWLLVQPCNILFNPEMPLKEDYDYTLQQLSRFGAVCRCEELLPTFLHYTNPGGVKNVRTPALEAACVRKLQARWGTEVVRNHPRRANEVLLKWKNTLKFPNLKDREP